MDEVVLCAIEHTPMRPPLSPMGDKLAIAYACEVNQLVQFCYQISSVEKEPMGSVLLSNCPQLRTRLRGVFVRQKSDQQSEPSRTRLGGHFANIGRRF